MQNFRSFSFLFKFLFRMLYAYAMQYKDADPINVTYVVSGIVGSNGNTVSHSCDC